MKKITISILTLAISALGYAITPKDSLGYENKDAKTLFSNAKMSGGFYNFGIKNTKINGSDAIFFRTSASFVLGHNFNIGIAGNWLMTDVNSNLLNANGYPYFISMGYGGFVFEPILLNREAVHLTFPIEFGVGGAGYTEGRWYDSNSNWDINANGKTNDVFLYVEPGANVELNVFKNLRLDVGASYRMLDGIQLTQLSRSDLEGLNINVGLKIGWF